MKRYFIIMVAALAAFVSCQKDNLKENPQVADGHLVFKATISTDDTRTTLDMSQGSYAKIYWEATDTITITDSKSHTANYKLISGAGTKNGVFAYSSGDKLDSASVYNATYGQKPSTMQYYAASESGSLPSVPLHMTAAASPTSDGLVFTADCAVFCFKVTDASHKIMRITADDYYLTSTTEVDVANQKDFYMVVPADDYSSFAMYDNNDQVVYSTNSVTVENNHVSVIEWAPTAWVDCTTKGFHGTHAWVQLWKNGPKWAETNVGAEKPADYGWYFAWGYGRQACVRNAANTGWVSEWDNQPVEFSVDYFPNLDDASYFDAAAYNWGSAWGVPMNTDLQALIDNCSDEYSDDGVVFNGKGDYAKNSIFLPAAGSGMSAGWLEQTKKGVYWSSVSNESEGNNKADYLTIDREKNTSSVSYSAKNRGCSVRPILIEENTERMHGVKPWDWNEVE